MELSKNRIQKLGKKIKRCQLLVCQENSELEFSDGPELVNNSELLDKLQYLHVFFISVLSNSE